MNQIVGVLILAGGKSERMFFPKSYLIYKGKTFLENIAEGYFNAGIRNICLVIRREYCEGEWKQYFKMAKPFISTIEKTDSSQGRSQSLKLGLKNLLDVSFCFIHNVDNPFIDKEVVECLFRNRNSYGYTIVQHEGRRGHPLLISQKIIRKITTMENKDFNLKDILMEFPKRIADVSSKEVLLNINTSEDYEKNIINA